MRNFFNKYRKELLDTGINVLKKVVHKVGEFLGNKVAVAEAKS